MRWLLRGCVSILMVGLVVVARAQTVSPTPTPASIEVFVPEVVNEYPHDPAAYTQGLLLHDGYLYESTGREGESSLRKVEIDTGDVLQQVDVDEAYFAEGLALVDDRLIQLTWDSETAFVYDLDSFDSVDTYLYTGEGWGLCYDGEVVWRSDGTEILTAHDPETFEAINELQVTYQGYPANQVAAQNGRLLSQLNELECVGSDIYANVWFTDLIVRIDATTGEINGIIFANDLLTPEERASLNDPNAVLNGIAYNPDTDTFYLTGKYWPKLFEVRLTTPPTP
jgi:glutamine cyclotransferase